MLAAGPGPHQDWLAVHGLLDNAGSWGRLAPLLPSGIRLTCLELPGHGRSDHLPPGGLYHWLELTLLLERARAAMLQGQGQLDGFGAGELLAEDLRAAQDALGEITGVMTPDDLLGKIFSSFCIGK